MCVDTERATGLGGKLVQRSNFETKDDFILTESYKIRKYLKQCSKVFEIL